MSPPLAMADAGARLGLPVASVARQGLVASVNAGWSVADRLHGVFERPSRQAVLHAIRVSEAGRGAEVANAALTYRPNFGTLSTQDAKTAGGLVREALAGLRPQVVINRFDSTLTGFRSGAEPWLSTVHDRPLKTWFGQGQRLIRDLRENVRGIYGDDALAGHTVYGSVQFTPRSAPLTQAVSGVEAFGDRALQLRSPALARTTFAAADTGLGLAELRVAPRELLADVVLERLARTHGFVRDPFTPPITLVPALRGADTLAQRRSAFQQLLRDTPRHKAVAQLRDYLTSDALRNPNGLIEAQVRGVTKSDVWGL